MTSARRGGPVTRILFDVPTIERLWGKDCADYKSLNDLENDPLAHPISSHDRVVAGPIFSHGLATKNVH
jgi:hypothetical protein